MCWRRIKSCLVLSLVLVILSGCATTGPGGKKSLIIIPVGTEVSIGHDMDGQVRSSNRILADSAWSVYIDEIGQRLVRVCDRRDIEYHFAVIDSNMVNAFAAPGGYIYFYTGLLKMVDNEAELAAVVAHEISHVVARHGVKRLQAAIGVQLLQQLIFSNSAEALQTAVNVGIGLSFATYSRANEHEADSYGIEYMVRAGYNPEASITMFEKLASLSDGSPGFFERLSMSHPETLERIQDSKALIESMKPLPDSLEYYRTRYQKMRRRLP